MAHVCVCVCVCVCVVCVCVCVTLFKRLNELNSSNKTW